MVMLVLLDEVLVQYGSVLRSREARLMEVCDWQGMSDEKWTSILKVTLVVNTHIGDC